MAKTVTIRIDEKTYKKFTRMARAESRSLANFIETAVNHHIRESAFVDDAEMADILSSEELVERIRAGSRDARTKEGRMIG